MSDVLLDAPPPTVAGSHMSLLRPAPPRARKSDSRKIGDVSKKKVFDRYVTILTLLRNAKFVASPRIDLRYLCAIVATRVTIETVLILP